MAVEQPIWACTQATTLMYGDPYYYAGIPGCGSVMTIPGSSMTVGTTYVCLKGGGGFAWVLLLLAVGT